MKVEDYVPGTTASIHGGVEEVGGWVVVSWIPVKLISVDLAANQPPSKVVLRCCSTVAIDPNRTRWMMPMVNVNYLSKTYCIACISHLVEFGDILLACNLYLEFIIDTFIFTCQDMTHISSSQQNRFNFYFIILKYWAQIKIVRS